MAVRATPEEQARRNHAAIAHVAALQPGNSTEVRLACRSIIAAEYANRCLQ